MEEFKIALAGKIICVSALHASTRSFCQDYLTEGTADFSVEVTPESIAYERRKSALEDQAEGIAQRQFSDAYLETLAIYRKIADRMLDWDTLLFHGSVIAVDGSGYLFTAKSGTGKSTHTRLWRQHFGGRAVMVNDDKPLLRITHSGVWACGTPWDGKHRLSTNTMVPLKGICILERGKENRIRAIRPQEALPMLLQQSHRPTDPGKLEKLLELLDKLMNGTGFYRLECNMDPEAAQIAYSGMQGKDVFI